MMPLRLANLPSYLSSCDGGREEAMSDIEGKATGLIRPREERGATVRSEPPHRVKDDDDYDGEELDGGGRAVHERTGQSGRVDEN